MSVNAGRLFKNPDYQEGSKRPMYKGQCEIDGIQKLMAAWIKTSKDGKKYMYVTFEKMDTPPIKQKIIPTKNKNQDGIRKTDKIATGKKEEKIKTADIDVSGIPF